MIRGAATIAAAAAIVIGTATAYLAAQGQRGFGNDKTEKITTLPTQPTLFFDHDGAPLTGRRAWNAARAMGGPNWRP
jgi:hypothetical protein